MRDTGVGLDDTLDQAVRLVEEAVECVAGCGCWRGDGVWRWDDPSRIESAAARLGPETSEIFGAVERIAAMSDDEARACRQPLWSRLHASSSAPPRGDGYDPRTHFRRALETLRRCTTK